LVDACRVVDKISGQGSFKIRDTDRVAKQGQPLVSLKTSLQPVISHFNCNQGSIRFLALLSPT
jgi:hypothetical protein